MARALLPSSAAVLLLLALFSAVTAQTTVNIGLILSTSGLACLRMAEHWYAALTAIDYVHNQTWWPATARLNLTIVDASTAYDCWYNSQQYVQSFKAAGQAPVALVGPQLSDGMLYTRFVASAANIPVVGYSTTSYAISDLQGAAPNTFFRTCQSDATTANAIYLAMAKLGIQQFNVMYIHDSFGRTFFELLDGIAQDGNVTLVTEVSFESQDKHSIDLALERLKESPCRITVLVAVADDAAQVMLAARELEMTGKGWQYIGAGWVAAHNWIDNLTPAQSEEVLEGMQGVIGIVPDDDMTPKFMNGKLMNFKYIPGVTQAGNPAKCPGLLSEEYRTKGVPTGPYVPYAFDAVWAVASAYAKAWPACPGCVTGADVKREMAANNMEFSPLTSKITFLPNGDKFNNTLNLVNVVGENVNIVGTWQAKAPNATNATTLQWLTAGEWGPFSQIIYPGGGTAVPADRVAEADHLGVWFYFLVLLGVLLSVLLGNAMHRHHLYTFPESGATIIIGMLIGVFLLAVSDSHLIQKAKFDPELFSLALLPIIIFESGYSLNLDAFFSQIGSVLMFALAGTVTATIICGLGIFEFGKSGIIPSLSFEESFSLASLVSATDPVATLSVFSALNVQPHLYSIVYGEAVLNDAVAIVLYRTFTKFLTVQATPGLWTVAVIMFFVILIGSTIFGIVFGALATLSFKYLRMAYKGSDGRAETCVLLLFAYGSYAFAEACTLSGIVASLFCGITMNHYTTQVLSDAGRHMAYHNFKILAYLSETSVFVQVGINVVAFSGDFRLGFVVLLIILCIVSRAAQVFTYANVLNCFRTNPIPTNHIIQIWHAGLRGAIAYALSTGFPSQNIGLIINATSCIVVFTIFVMGGTTTTSLKLLKIECGMSTDQASKQISEDLAAAQAESVWKRRIASFDNTYVKPILFRNDQEVVDAETPAQAH